MVGLTGEQVRAGRAMLGWEQSELAERANVSLKTVKRLEATAGQVDARSDWAVKKALELGGIDFIGDHDWRNRCDGVRFAKDKTGKLRDELVDNVSGLLAICLKIKTDDDADFFERPLEEIVEVVMEELRESVADKIQLLLHKT